MATGAPAPKLRAQRKADAAAPGKTKRWWQQIILYPAFAVALVTAGRQSIDKVRGLKLGVPSANAAEKEALLWQKNASCVGLNSNGFKSPNNVDVDATICRSGDILVHAITPQNTEVFKWLPLDDVVRAAGAGGFVPSAQAATLSVRAPPHGATVAQPMVKVALLQIVLCTRIDGRYLHRRIQTPQGCFDEVIDTFTGALVSRNPAPCQC